MDKFSFEEREAALRRMADEGVEILVIGGGITGAGVALDAAARGYRTGLVERGDFGSGTSSKSTKLVHGGIRYLPQFDFALVREALVERGMLVRNAPFLVKPIGFVLPLFKENKRPLGTPIVPPFGIGMNYLIRMGLLMYDLMAGRLGVKMHRHLGVKTALQLAPGLRLEGMTDAFIYYDAQTDDTLLTNIVIRTAAQHGTRIASYAEVTSFDQQDGKITAAHVTDRLTGDTYTIRANLVINAGGVFAGKIEEMAGSGSQVSIKPAKGIHLTIPREALQIDTEAIVLPETEDGRLMFIVPWGPRVTVGTTDTHGGDVEAPIATDEDIDYLLRHVNRYMRCQISRRDIISAWAGYRPLISPRKGDKISSKLSRTHVVLDSPGGMVTVVGGKLTTYRRMAQDTLDHIAARMGKAKTRLTASLPLVGAQGWQESAQAVSAAQQEFDLSAGTVSRLNNYGSEATVLLDLIRQDRTLAKRIVPDLPYIFAEVVYACRYQMAIHLDDMLIRRLHLNFEDWSRGLDSAPTVAAVMARELGWDNAEIERQIARYRELLQTDPVLR